MSEVRPRRYLVTLERDSKGRLLAARIGVPIIDDYLRYLAAIGRSPTTWSSYAYDLVVFCRWLTDHQPDHATDHAVEELLQNLTAAQIFTFVEDELSPQGDRAPLALSTVHRRVIALAKFFDWAEVVGIVSRNPVPHERPQGAFHPRQERRTAFLRVPHPLPRPAPIDELASFSKSLLTWRDHALVALLVGSGLRLSEALDLRLSDLDWGGKQVFIRHGKGGRQRYAMVPDSAWAALKAYLETERPEPAGEKASDRASLGEEPVFVSLHGPNRGKRLTSAGAQSIFRHHRAKASTPNVTPHRLRHTCGTELHRAGLSLELIQEQLGHRRLDSTRLYVYLSNERLRQAYQAIQPELYRVPYSPASDTSDAAAATDKGDRGEGRRSDATSA